MIDLKNVETKILKQFNNCNGELLAKMFTNEEVKILTLKIKKNCSKGYHQHLNSFEVVYVLSGEGLFNLDGNEEVLKAGDIHYCKENSYHSITNLNVEDLNILCIVGLK